MFDYSIMEIFRTVDRFQQGVITPDNLRIFLQEFECSLGLNQSDITNWIKRYDTDVDNKLTFIDFVNSLSCATCYQPKVVSKANLDRSVAMQQQNIVSFREEDHSITHAEIEDPRVTNLSLTPQIYVSNMPQQQQVTTLPTFNTGEVVKIDPTTPIKEGRSRVGILKPQNRMSAQTIRTGTTGLSTALE